MKKSVLVVSVILVTTVWIDDATACRCVPPKPLSQTFERTPAVFEGTVVSITPFSSTYELAGQKMASASNAFDFVVDRSWKGVTTSRVQIWSPRAGTACGSRFKIGETYIVNAHWREDQWHSSSCSGSKPTSRAEDALLFLETKKTLSLVDKPSGFPTCLAALVAAASGAIEKTE